MLFAYIIIKINSKKLFIWYLNRLIYYTIRLYLNITFDGKFFFAGLSTLVEQLEGTKYSTILYVLNNRNTKDAGYCDMAQKLSTAYNKSIIFWPCPKMKVRYFLLLIIILIIFHSCFSPYPPSKNKIKYS